MPYIPYHFFSVLLVALMLGSQFVMYRIARRLLSGTGSTRKLARVYMPFLMALANLTLPFLYLAPWLFYHGFLRKYLMWPFYAYETISIGVLLVASVSYPIKLLAGFIRRIKKDRARP